LKMNSGASTPVALLDNHVIEAFVPNGSD